MSKVTAFFRSIGRLFRTKIWNPLVGNFKEELRLRLPEITQALNKAAENYINSVTTNPVSEYLIYEIRKLKLGKKLYAYVEKLIQDRAKEPITRSAPFGRLSHAEAFVNPILKKLMDDAGDA